jgi:hypothetical protein
MKKYLVQTRSYAGRFETRGYWGRKSGISWTKWKTKEHFTEYDKAEKYTDKVYKGFMQVRTTYGGRVIYTKGM